MAKLDEYEFKGLPEELTEFKDDVTSIVNSAKYSNQVLVVPPAWTGRNGESAFYISGSISRWYYYVDNSWRYTGFNSDFISAWLVYSGTGAGKILGSYGVDSLTSFGVGDYQILWSTSFPTVNYLVSGLSKEPPGGGSILVGITDTAGNPSRGYIRIKTYSQDSPYLSLIATGG